MSHSQIHRSMGLFLDMHGLIFETSIWHLAGSTRYFAQFCVFFSFVCWKMIDFDAFFWHLFMVLWLVQKRNKQQYKNTQQKQNWCWMSWKTTRKQGVFFLVTQTKQKQCFWKCAYNQTLHRQKKSTKKTDFETPNFNERKDTKFDYFVGNMRNKLLLQRADLLFHTTTSVRNKICCFTFSSKKRKLCVDRSPFSQHSSWKKRHQIPQKMTSCFLRLFSHLFCWEKRKHCCAQKSFQVLIQKNSMRRTLFFFGVGKHLWNKSLRENFSNAERKIGKVSVFFLTVNSRRFYWTKWPKQQKKCQRKSTKRLPNKVLKEAYFCKNTKKWHSIHHFHSNNLLWMVKIPDSGHTLSDTEKLDRFRTTQIPTTKLCLRVIFFVWKK